MVRVAGLENKKTPICQHITYFIRRKVSYYADMPADTTNTQDDSGILGLAQKHALKLYEELGEKTFASMKASIKQNMRDKNWAAMKQLLELAFVAAFEKKPIVLMLVMKDNDEFKEYCKCLYCEMEKLT